jgi:sRNA-binding carbon storage regulator CsrA
MIFPGDRRPVNVAKKHANVGLVIKRDLNERILIDADGIEIWVTLVGAGSKSAKIGVLADRRRVRVHREEVARVQE